MEHICMRDFRDFDFKVGLWCWIHQMAPHMHRKTKSAARDTEYRSTRALGLTSSLRLEECSSGPTWYSEHSLSLTTMITCLCDVMFVYVAH